VAATEPRRDEAPRGGLRGSVLAAAFLLPGVMPATTLTARAEVAPERAELALRWLSYQDGQPGLARTRVRSPAASLTLPLSERWSLQVGASQDTVSGASPRWHSSISGASVQTDQRRAFDARLNHHGDGQGWSVGAARSDENDFASRTLSAEWRQTSDDRNRTWTLGLAGTRDRIGATGQPLLDERRETLQLLAGVTQAWTARDLLQLTVTHSRARGYHSDPYKIPDQRPRERDRSTLQARWNHHLPAIEATLRSGYRYYRDTFGIRAHTVDAEWVQSFGERLRIGPVLRYHTQRAAFFYVDPLPLEPDGVARPPQRDPLQPDAFISADSRLSALGAAAVALKAQWQWREHIAFDLRVEAYRQQADWRLGGTGSPGLAPLTARQWQVGTRVTF
jgi:hypothetical protein